MILEDSTQVDITIDWQEVEALCKRNAPPIASRFKGFCEANDLAQEAYCWALGNTERVEKFYAPTYVDKETGEELENKNGREALRRRLKGVMNGYAQQLKAERLGYSVSDLTFYSKALVEELLPQAFDDDTVLPNQSPSDTPRTKGNAAEGNNYLALRVDIQRGYQGLGDDDQEILWRRFVELGDLDVMAVDYGITKRGVEKKIDRALDRLVDSLGGRRPIYPEGPGSRSVRSNAQAQAINREQVGE